MPSGKTAGSLSKQGHCTVKGHVIKATAYIDPKKNNGNDGCDPAKDAVAHADVRPQKLLKLENLEKKQRVGTLRTAYYQTWNAEPDVRAPELFKLQSTNDATSLVGEPAKTTTGGVSPISGNLGGTDLHACAVTLSPDALCWYVINVILRQHFDVGGYEANRSNCGQTNSTTAPRQVRGRGVSGRVRTRSS